MNFTALGCKGAGDRGTGRRGVDPRAERVIYPSPCWCGRHPVGGALNNVPCCEIVPVFFGPSGAVLRQLKTSIIQDRHQSPDTTIPRSQARDGINFGPKLIGQQKAFKLKLFFCTPFFGHMRGKCANDATAGTRANPMGIDNLNLLAAVYQGPCHHQPHDPSTTNCKVDHCLAP